MPSALILTVVIITVFYTVFATAMAGLLPVAELAAAEAPVSAAVSQIPGFGSLAGTLSAALAVVVVTGTLATSVFSQPRVQYQMARDGLWFPKFGEIHPKYKTPAFSIVVQCALAIFFIFVSNISEILGYFTDDIPALHHWIPGRFQISQARRLPPHLSYALLEGSLDCFGPHGIHHVLGYSVLGS